MNLSAPGSRIADRYEVASQPLVGGMGIVYLCFDHQERRPVALKTFRPKYLSNRAVQDLFLREGTTWVNLGRHPHVVRCYGVERIGDGREVYLVLELVAKGLGRRDASLRSWLLPGAPLSVEQALLFALLIARGMAYATAKIPGLVHRDLKPENVLVGADKLAGVGINRLRVTDFGLAKVMQEAGVRMSEALEGSTGLGRTQLTHGTVGTPLYMAPEQWMAEEVGVQTDVYALGCILYKMLAGRPAVAGGSKEALKRAHCEGKVQPLPRRMSSAVTEVVMRCLAVEPGARYGDWDEMEKALAMAYASVAGRAVPAPAKAQALHRSERVAAGWSYSALGTSYLDIGKVRVAQGYFERARDVGHKESDLWLEVEGLNNLGQAYIALGRAEQAIAYHEQALATLRGIREASAERSVEWIASLYGEGIILGSLGNAYADLRPAQRAIDYLKQALAVARKIGDRHSEGAVLGNLGAVHYRIGRVKQAIGYHEKALKVAREVGDRHGEGNALGNLGEVYRKIGKIPRALKHFQQHLEIAREIGDRRGEGTVLGNLGNVYSDLGQPWEAVEYFEQALVVTREVGDRRGEGIALTGLGNIYKNHGPVRQAIQYYEQALEIDREIGDQRGAGYDLMGLGNAYSDLGEVWRAIGYYEQAGAALEGVGDLMGSASVSFNLALMLFQNGRLTEALPHAERAAQIFTQVGHAQHAQQAQKLAASIRTMSQGFW